jgi:hypothetical protein
MDLTEDKDWDYSATYDGCYFDYGGDDCSPQIAGAN